VRSFLNHIDIQINKIFKQQVFGVASMDKKVNDKLKWREILQIISPVLIKRSGYSITLGLSKRFLIFNLVGRLIKSLEEDPHLNFISIIKSYKILGRILHGNFKDFYRDRNKLYFKNFFIEREVWQHVKNDLEWIWADYKDSKNVNFNDILMTITKRGVIVYENYKKHKFNVLLMTIHSGLWVPKSLQEKMFLTPKQRFKEEDIDTNKLYCKFILEKGGVWVDSKQSRFACDFNRRMDKSIYQDGSEKWIKKLWKEPLTQKETDDLHTSYKEFYFTIDKLANAHNFNIICDGHSMKNRKGRPNISIGTKAASKFYMPIIQNFKVRFEQLGYTNVDFDKPFKGGYITKWLNVKYPYAFVFSLEINKKLYMSKSRDKVVKYKLLKMSRDIGRLFDIDFDLNSLPEKI